MYPILLNPKPLLCGMSPTARDRSSFPAFELTTCSESSDRATWPAPGKARGMRTCAWQIYAAAQVSHLEFTIHGLVSRLCGDILKGIANQVYHRADHLVRCGVHNGSESRSAMVKDIYFWPGLHADLQQSSHATVVPFIILCRHTGSLTGKQHLTLSIPLHNATVSAHLPSRNFSSVAPACSVRVCLKAYGAGGALSSPSYMAEWMRNWHKVGVAELVVYALEPLPDNISSALRLSKMVRIVPFGSAPFTAADYKAQKGYVSDIEARFVVAMSHCVHDAIGRAEWALVLDVDEALVLAANTSLCSWRVRPKLSHDTSFSFEPRGSCDSISLPQIYHPLHCNRDDTHRRNGSHLKRPAHRAAFSHPPCRDQWEAARAALSNATLREELDSSGDPSRQINRWKTMCRPHLMQRLPVDAHGCTAGKLGLASVEGAYIAHFTSDSDAACSFSDGKCPVVPFSDEGW